MIKSTAYGGVYCERVLPDMVPVGGKKIGTNFFFQKKKKLTVSADVMLITGEPPYRGNACKRTGNRTDTDGDDAASSTAGRGLSVACATILLYIVHILLSTTIII